MSSILRKTALAVMIFFCAAFSAFPQSLEDLQDGAAALSGSLAKSLPFNAAVGLDWSDAYIGKLIPGVPHFGVGATLGVTTMDMPSLKKVTEIFDVEIPEIPILKDKMILPAFAAEARIGGFFLPFDIGVKYGTLPSTTLLDDTLSLKYSLFGADLRWAIMEGNAALPNISVGIGFNSLSGSIGANVGTDIELPFTFDGDHTLKISSPEINLAWKTMAVEAKVQISKQFFIITPYLGIGAGYSWSQAGYELNTHATLDGKPLNDSQKEIIQDFLTSMGLSGIVFNDNGFSSMVNNNGFNIRAFGGLSLNLAVVRLNLNAMYNFLDGQFGATFGLRVQL